MKYLFRLDKSRKLQRKLLNFNYSLVKIKSTDYSKNLKNFYKRTFRIIDFFVGKRLFVYNGKIFRKFLVTKNHVGFFIGEFSFTRRYGMGADMHRRRKKKLK